MFKSFFQCTNIFFNLALPILTSCPYFLLSIVFPYLSCIVYGCNNQKQEAQQPDYFSVYYWSVKLLKVVVFLATASLCPRCVPIHVSVYVSIIRHPHARSWSHRFFY
jgi:hypothetical protein